MKNVFCISVVIAATLVVFAAMLPARAEPAVGVLGEFVGSTPGGEPFGALVDLPPDASPPLRCALTLHHDPATRTPTFFDLRIEYDDTTPPAARKVVTIEKHGRWAIGKGTASDPNAVVFELVGGVNFLKVSDTLVQAMNPDRTLAVGNGGWSYTLNRKDVAEAIVIPSAEWGRSSESYTMTPLASGPTVFGVFEGRSPAQGIARELKMPTDPNRMKVKWRVTLYQDAATSSPTTYKIEGSLHRQERREGRWQIVRKDDGTVLYQLTGSKTQADLFLQRGDDNVLYFLGHDRELLVGHADFSYTLNRRDLTLARP